MIPSNRISSCDGEVINKAATRPESSKCTCLYIDDGARRKIYTPEEGSPYSLDMYQDMGPSRMVEKAPKVFNSIANHLAS